MLASLQKGNKANVTIIKDDKEIKGTIAANPRMQRFDFEDFLGLSLIVKPVDKQKLAKTENQEQQQDPAQVKKGEAIPGQSQSPIGDQAEGREQSQQQGQQPGNKESQKADLADEQKNNTAQRKKQGARI